MFGVKREEAVLESKTIIEKKNVPLLGQAITFASAEQSGSFLSRDTFYMFTFRVGDKRKEFRVTKEVYEKIEEGTKGVLVYQGNIFDSFLRKEDDYRG